MTLDAKKARSLMPRNYIEKCITEIEELIKKSAEADGESIRIPYEMWKANKSGMPDESKEPLKSIIETFTKRGFKVSEIYEARQFVDIGMRISWKEDE